MKTAVEYLQGALRELHASRDEIDRQINVIETTLGELTGTESSRRADSSDKESRPTVREIALELAERERVVTPNDVLEAAHEQGNDAKYESVSSILSRLNKEGVLIKGGRRGTYMLPNRRPEHTDQPQGSEPPETTPNTPRGSWELDHGDDGDGFDSSPPNFDPSEEPF